MKMSINKQAEGNSSKIRKLISFLQKSNGKTIIGGSDALISPRAAKILAYCILLILTGGLFTGAYLVQPHAAWIIPVKSLAQTLMLVLLILCFALSVKNIVTVLYTADDLELLLPLPFSANQIVMAKLCVASGFPLILSFIILNSVCLGFGIRAGAGVPFIIGTVLSGILIPVTGIAAATLLVVIIFRLFGFIRNRDITVAIGGLFTLGLSFAYITVNSRLRQGDTGEAAAAAVSAFSTASAAFPNISFMIRFMFEGSIPGLLISLAVTAAVMVLAVLAVKAFYLTTALSIQNTAAKKKVISKEALRSVKKNSALKALTFYEAKSSRRNPAYLIYGYAMSFLWPLLFALPLIIGNNSLLSGFRVPLDTISALLGSISFAITASCFACGFNVLPGTAFSREGRSFDAVRALPLDFKDYYRSKRNYSLLNCSLGSVLYVIILGVICVAAGFISIKSSWVIPAGACISFHLNLIFINLMLLKNSRKPNFNWDSETELSRKLGAVNIIAVVLGVVMLTIFLASAVLLPMLNDPQFTKTILIIFAAAALVIIVLSYAVNSFCVKAASNNLMKLENASSCTVET